MTPTELLEDVKSRFYVLLHDDQDALSALLRKALMKYQELAGFSNRVRFQQADVENNIVNLPSDFLSRVVLTDYNGRYISCDSWDGKLEMRLLGNEVYPITLTYLVDVLKPNPDEYQLPPASVSLLGEYLELLISIPNSERQRRIAIAGKLDVADIPAESDLAARKAELEASMRLNRAIAAPISIC